ncbi:hypothetical protein BKA67DRAFT_649683 [Truncatella angustata]|uniref:Uncharacterized protein n=1 Tax=Truncatella angustata TaxID=152316 RepID=A0A9P8ZSJ5_9PEZI|nr:uncharacterized protein BKA67DRAFT_649683 [Truncatella angustata]KAH6648031.1 hypothetical protein BKA67DRAFT_649683 [Truncatella angustata]KAH8198640.1 hypothetical protein TruAng_007181 [Truncatella angustata]
MASETFVDFTVLLRAAPLVSATSALWFSADQYTFLNNFLRPEHRNEAESVVPSYFKTFFPGGLTRILFLYGVSISTGTANFWARPNASWHWYAAGTAFAVAHFAFAPRIISVVQSLTENRHPKQGNRDLKKWLDIHVVRSILADLPAWICFVVATLTSLQPL